MALVVLEVLIAAFAYSAATCAVWAHHASGKNYWRVTALAAIGLIAQPIALVHMSLRTGAMVIGLGTALSLFAWQVALLLWLFSLRRSVGALGLVVYPVAGLCAIAGLLVPDPHSARDALDWPLQLHIILSMLAYGLLTLGAVQAAVLSIQHRQLRRRPPSGVFTTLPPLQTMEEMLFSMLRLGFVLLTLALISGWLFVDNLFAQHLVHKTVLSIVAWLVFGTLLWGRHRFGWRGQTAMRWTLGGFATLMLAYFGSKLVLEFILRR